MRFLSLIFISLFFTATLEAQLCTPQTVTFPITPTSTLQYTPSYSSGVVLFPFMATAGCTYTFSTCGQSSIDTYLRLHNSAYTLLGAWDDQCALQSTFTWTCPTAGQYYVHLSRYVCTALTAATTMSYVVSCPTPPCNNPVVNAGPDVVICAGQSTQLNGAVSAGTGTGTGGSASSITITLSGTGFLDETSWNLNNAAGTSVGSGGPYTFATTNTVTLTNVGTGPYSFSLETQGFFNDNNATYTISCNGTVVNTGSIAGGQTTTASVTGCGGTTGGTLPITYVWSPGATLSSTTVLNPTANPTVTTTYTLTATSGTCTSTDQVTVFVSPAPTINAGPDVTICTGQTTTLNGSASAVGGFGGSMAVNIFSGSSLDETTWNMTNSLGVIIASGGPYATASNQTITINSPSNPPFTFNLETQGTSNSNVAGYNVLCAGTSISGGLAILTGGQTIAIPISGCPGTIPTTLSWSPGATLSSTTITNPIASPSATTTYTLTATANGCTSNDQVVVTVVPGPTVTVNNATICSGQTATLTATPSATGGTYLWTPGGAITQTINVSPTATTSYSVSYSNGSCASAPASGVVTVSSSPTLSVNSSTICPGASATLTATANPTGGTYLWTPGGSTTQTLTVSPTSTTTYSVAYSLNGCSSSSANGTVTVSNVVDWANIQSPGASTICQGQTLTIYGQVFEAGVTPPTGQGAGITVQFAYNTSNTNPSTWPTASWSAATYNPLSLINPNNDEYSGLISGLSPGTYYYAFSYAMNGCTSYGGYSAAGGGLWDGATNVNGTLIVNPNVTPTFNPIAAICAGGALNALPTTSTNLITGTWSPALNNQQTTTYIFTPTAGVCATTATLTVTVNPLPIAAITVPTTTILTCATPSITLTATGGGTYSWSNGTAVVGAASALNVTSPGTYTVTVTSASGCTATASQIITQNISPPVVAITPPSTSILTCTTTSVNLTATGGGTYSWSNGTTVVGTTATITVNAPGTYTCTVTGTNGCTSSIAQVITQNISLPNSTIATPSTTILTCTTPSIDLQASGGISYSWSNGTSSIGTSSLISASTPGTYTVTVTGSNGCIGTASQVITQNISLPNAAITSPATTILTCTTPSITLTGTGGGTYSWFDGTSVIGATATVNISSANTYTLTVTGTNGCDATATISITENFVVPIPIINANSTILTCTTTSITLVATGGGTYLWTGGSTSSSLSVTTPGTYSVTVTSPNGCSASTSQIITQNITAPTTSVTSSNNGLLTCAVTSITLTAVGGGSYLWSNGNTNAIMSVSTPGIYSVTVTATNGCTATASTTVTQDIVAPAAAITPPSTTVLTCATTSISLVATGGNSYSWSNGTANVGANATLNVTLPGTYTVTATGANGCTATASITITQNSTPPPANINPPTSTVLNCTTTSITLTATGGVSYSWSNGTAVIGTNASVTVTTTGTYTVTVTAAIGCTATATQIVTQNIAPPLVVITPPTSTTLTCATTSIQLTASGGGTYSWSNGTAVVGTTASISVTAAGTYTVTVTGTNGCTATGSQVITQNISLPLASINIPTTNVLTCTVTSITLTATGGASYSWFNGTAIVGTGATLVVTTPGSYTVTVTGANGCTATAVQNITQNISAPNVTITPPSTTILTCTATNINLITSGGAYSWSNGTAVVGTSSMLAVSAPGTYTVTVTGGNGCTGTASQIITQNSTAPVAAINALTTTVLTCTTPAITLTATGGGTYSWSNGTAIVGTTASLIVSTPGTYTVTVTSANGCTATAVQTITQNNTAPSVSITAPISTILTCTNTSISLTANGVGSISWTNPALISVTPTISVTTPGIYTLTIIAANGCSATASQTITQNITAPSAAITAPITTILTCTTTSITLTATGGGTYSWSNGTVVVGTAATLNVTSPGTYTVTVTGTNGCTATAASTITQNTTAPTAGINTPSTTILTCTSASIALTATGGGSYSWSNGTAVVGSAAALSVTALGTYTVTVTGSNGCTATAAQIITQNIVTPTAAITNNTNATVLDCNTTQISLTGVGGTSASWSNGTSVVSSVANLSVTTAGTYTYTGTNANGCFDTESITITFTPNTNPAFTQIAAICTNGLFTLPTTSTNNVAGTWSPAPNYTTTTTYTFQPNAGLCANTASMTIIVNPYPVISTQNDTICVGQSTTITSNVNLAGGTYNWTPSNALTSSISVSPIATTNYQVIYSLLGCADTSSVEIFVKPVSTPLTSNQTICNGQTAELIATAPLPGGSFVWSTTQINDTIQVSPSTTTTYTVVYNLNGCLSPTVNSIVTVNPVPTLGVNNSTICAGDNAIITAIPNLLGGTFYWGTPGVAGAASQTVSPLNDSTISVYYTLSGCTSPVATSSITVNPLPIATFSANITQGCNPLSVTLTADDVSNTSYSWSTSNALTGAGSQTNLQFQMNGGFDVSLTATLNGCTVTEIIANYIQVDNYPIAAFEPSSTMFTEPNQTLNFMNNSLGASTYAWNFGDGGTSSEEGPNHTFVGNELGVTVILTAISNLGCTDTAQYYIGYDPGLVYYIPNSFTPDGDMNNQVFTPIFTSGIDNYNYTFYVFNRWGEIIFESKDPSIGWDGSYGVEGKDAEVGVYTYQIFIKIPNFDERKMIVGHVNLIR